MLDAPAFDHTRLRLSRSRLIVDLMPQALLKQVKKARLELLACVTSMHDRHDYLSLISSGGSGSLGLLAGVHEFKVDAQDPNRDSLVTTAFELIFECLWVVPHYSMDRVSSN